MNLQPLRTRFATSLPMLFAQQVAGLRAPDFYDGEMLLDTYDPRTGKKVDTPEGSVIDQAMAEAFAKALHERVQRLRAKHPEAKSADELLEVSR